MNGSAHTPSSYSLAIRRPVTVAMIFLTLIVFGWKSYQELPINLMPDISYPTLTVRTEYANAAPEDVEKLITRTLEERLSVVSGVVEISSVSSAGLSEIIMEFVWGTDMNVAMQDVRESLDLFDPPQGVTKKPIILRYDPTLDPVMRIALFAGGAAFEGDSQDAIRRRLDALIAIREAAERQIKSDLEAESGIAQVLVKGGREAEVQIHVDSERIKSLGISLENVVRSLEQHNINLSGGKLKEGKAEYLVRTLNEFRDVDEIRGVIVRNPSGQQYRLIDLATVELGHKDLKTIVRVNGREAVALEFYKEGDANTVQVCNKLKDFFGFDRKQGIAERIILYIASRAVSGDAQEFLREIERVRSMGDRLRTRLPEYAAAVSISDQSRFIVASIREVQQTALVGGVLALLILFLFLREVKSTLIIGVAITI